MEKLSLTSLSADYGIESKYIIQSEERYCSSFKSSIQIKATDNRSDENYHFTVNRSEVLLNGEKASKLMDRIIYEMGNTLYPVSLKVSPLLAVLDVLNFDEIRLRRQKQIEDITKKYPSNNTVQQYIRMAAKNFTDKNAFIRSLYRDSFFNLYFRDIYTTTPEDEAKAILWVNFPKREMNRTYLYQVKPIDDSQIITAGKVMKIIPELDWSYDMTYTIGKCGEIHSINGKVTGSYNRKDYIKQLTVNQINLKTNTAKWESIIL